jgi:hypothetical protein
MSNIFTKKSFIIKRIYPAFQKIHLPCIRIRVVSIKIYCFKGGGERYQTAPSLTRSDWPYGPESISLSFMKPVLDFFDTFPFPT